MTEASLARMPSRALMNLKIRKNTTRLTFWHPNSMSQGPRLHAQASQTA